MNRRTFLKVMASLPVVTIPRLPTLDLPLVALNPLTIAATSTGDNHSFLHLALLTERFNELYGFLLGPHIVYIDQGVLRDRKFRGYVHAKMTHIKEDFYGYPNLDTVTHLTLRFNPALWSKGIPPVTILAADLRKVLRHD